jgi:hypothetical protein
MADEISVTIGQVTELTLITPIVPGRAPVLRKVLQSIQVNPESPIRRISTIHYARWVLIDGDTRLLFTSNFDGSWEQYLRDFSTIVPEGLDMIWSNCVDYPAGGSKQFEAFIAWVRKHQVKVDLYYAAYPDASVRDVLRALDWTAKTERFLRELQTPPGMG